MGGGNGQKAKMARERNPEKLRREREELERLQEEAKAAEFARKQAEAKRKLELEREAARLELQQMEKTVEIDENTQLLKDLEMLRSSQPDHIPSSMDETCSVNSQDGLAPFALQGRNCLEQFGLFMRNEDEEEEEATAGGAATGNAGAVATGNAGGITAGNGDAEEGEIDVCS